MSNFKFTGPDIEQLYDSCTKAEKYKKQCIKFFYTNKSKEAGRGIAAIIQRTFPDTYQKYGSVGGKAMYVQFISTEARDEAYDIYTSELEASLNGTGPGDLKSYRGNSNAESGNSKASGNTLYIIGAVMLVVAIIGLVIWKRRKKA